MYFCELCGGCGDLCWIDFEFEYFDVVMYLY